MIKLTRLPIQLIKNLDLKFEKHDIYLSKTNINHMKNKHPNDYKKYRKNLKKIISDPDYVKLNENNNSLEFIKKIDHKYVKVPVKPSKNGILYVRTLYTISNNNINKYLEKREFKKFSFF